MPRSIPIALIRGTAVRLHWTFVLLVTLIALGALASSGIMMAAQIVLFVCLIFACVVLHEFGHITVARQFGIETPEVVLLPIGGIAKLQQIPTDPRQELAIAIAGPAVNFILFGVLTLLLGRWPEWSAFGDLSQGEVRLIEQLAIFNMLVGLFNLLPAFPMDGGRVLRALLALALPHHHATRIAARVGQALAVGLGFLGLISGNILLIAIGIFVFLTAASEAKLEKVRHAIGGTPVRNVMVTGQAQFHLTDPITKAAEALMASDNEEFPVLAPDGRLEGFVLRSDILSGVGEASSKRLVRHIIRRDIPIVTLHSRAEEAAETIAGGSPIVGIVDDRGRFAGLVNWSNLLDALAIDEAMRHRHRKQRERMLF